MTDGTTGQEQWRAVRSWMKASRHELAVAAADLYQDTPKVEGTRLLCRPEWLPAEPVELGAAQLRWHNQAAAPATTGSGDQAAAVRPPTDGGEPFATYAEAIAALDRPALFENRPLYRLLAADLTGQHRLDLTAGQYFDSVSVGEALAHEFAATTRARQSPVLDRLPLRAAIGDPCDLPRRPASLAVTTLTLRRSGPGQASFLLHWRDPAKVTNAGGLYQVMPVGIFQPADDNPDSIGRDLNLWHSIARELSEELLGASEDYASFGSPVRYHQWPFYQRLTEARHTGTLRVWILGLGVDPLTMTTDMLTVAVIDADLFDEVFANLVAVNSEGRIINDTATTGFAFTESSVHRFSTREPMQAAGAAILRLAWKHQRSLLLG
ncbi:MAG TPA: hypothetical protein VGM14_20350 [Streptosporangiaceae bacterium]